MAYKVEIWHLIAVYRKGDLEDTIEYAYHTLSTSTRKEAKQFIENRLKGFKY